MWKYKSSDAGNISLHDYVIDEILFEGDDILLIFCHAPQSTIGR